MSENLSPAGLVEGDKKPHRRPLLILGGLVLLLLGVMAFLYLRDDAPADDSDFLIVWGDKALTNPLVEFMKELGPAHPEQLPSEMWMMEHTISEELLARNTSLLPAFHKLMATDASSWSLIDINASAFHVWSFPSLFCFGSRVLPEIIEDHVRRGERQEAVTLALEMHQFAHRLLKAEAGLHVYKETLDLQENASELLLKALEGTTSPDLLKQAQEQLSGRDPTPQDLILALKDQYAAEKAYLLDAVNDTGSFEVVFRDEDPSFIKRWYRPQRTINQHLEFCRQMVAGLDQGWAGAQAKADAWAGTIEKRTGGKWARYANPNFAGDGILLHVAPRRIACDTAIHITVQRMLMTSLAIRRYELAHHTSPRTLEELVPAFLSAVPVDAMNHTPLEWDATNHTLQAASPWPLDSPWNLKLHVLPGELPPLLGGKVTFGKDDARIRFLLGPEAPGEKSGSADTPSPR
ncbi:hypothetical protein [Roseimicrobium sp. ORNL1]|uniref:hypothetical protein n=1 Tax=Roseimicrobium sp. ORNL1 TaxID=2711231 RepID=UPI0013E0F718|nr:hypothetical protein [Roseimicrobium sp. ORNL1]QIF04278.1 hypothetical protein G5S37_23055 [Roseimicrobium sp. ORNL1]